jgi:DNA adenine methylase
VRYPGGKFRCFQKLINLIPAHRVYIESHLGGGAVLRNKESAELNIGIDCDPRVVSVFQGFPKSFRFICGRAEEFLTNYGFVGDEFVYADPPYWPASRASQRPAYRHDYRPEDHVRLLKILLGLPCKVMLSGYNNTVYKQMLAAWTRRTFSGTSHTGRREESVWLNYEPGELHDARYLGETFRQRQSIKRKRERWVARFSREPVAVQQAVLEDLQAVYSGKEVK